MTAVNALLVRLWSWRAVWLPLLALLVVLIATWLLVPRSDAPFVYEFF